MSKKFRDGLFWFFVIFFVILTTLISLYASGYKFNLSWPLKFNKILQKTGMLAVDTKPTGALVYLDGKAVKSGPIKFWNQQYATTPQKIKNVLPGEHNLRVELDGYWPFEKRLNIYPGQTTFAEDINLFLNDIPILVEPGIEGILRLSPSGKYLYAGSVNKVINLKNSQSVDFPTASSSDALWVGADKLFGEGRLLSADKGQLINYNETIGSGASLWHFDSASGFIYYKNKNSLNRLDGSSQANTMFLNGENFLDYESRGDHLFLITANNGRLSLKDYSFKTGQIETTAELPTIADYRFTDDQKPYLSLYDSRNRTLILIDPQNISQRMTINNVGSWYWLDDQHLIYNNDWEIYAFDASQNRSSLVTRVGEQIKEIIWNKRQDYIVFTTAQSVIILDWHNNVQTAVFKAEKLSSPQLDEKNGVLYFWAKIGQQEGIYKMLMQ